MAGSAVFSADVDASEGSASSRVATNMRACLILEAVAGYAEGLTPTEIARRLELPKQTVHRVCHTLVDQGFLIRNPVSRALTPGPRLRMLSSGVMRSSHILRHQILARVARETGETVNYVMPQSDGMRYVDRVETDWAFRVQLPIGSSVPFHCTASGKVWLASLDEAERHRIIGKLELSRQTEATICDADALAVEIARVAERGFSIDNQEFMDGMFAVSVPVHDPLGRYSASLAVHGPTVRLNLEQAEPIREVLKLASADLTEALFAVG